MVKAQRDEVYLPMKYMIGTRHALPTKANAWQWINWNTVMRSVKSLQCRIVKAATLLAAALTKAL